MQIFIYAIMAVLLVSAILTKSNQARIDAPTTVVPLQTEVDRYRMFMYVANLYMKTYTGGAGTITWSALKAAQGAPSGAASVNVPSTWKVVVAADSSWVACTPMDERAIGILQQLAVRSGSDLNPTQVAGQQFVVVGMSSDVGSASQCNI